MKKIVDNLLSDSKIGRAAGYFFGGHGDICLLMKILALLPRDGSSFFGVHRAGGRGRGGFCYQYLVPLAPTNIWCLWHHAFSGLMFLGMNDDYINKIIRSQGNLMQLENLLTPACFGDRRSPVFGSCGIVNSTRRKKTPVK